MSASTKLKPTASEISGHCHIVMGVFTPMLAKHSKSFSLIDFRRNDENCARSERLDLGW